jgi:hypothetical protein
MDLKLEDRIVSNLNNLYNKNNTGDKPKNTFNLFGPTEDYAYSVVLPYLKNTFELSSFSNCQRMLLLLRSFVIYLNTFLIRTKDFLRID